MFHQYKAEGLNLRINVPFLSSIVTVSFAHFIKNLPGARVSLELRVGALWMRAQLVPTEANLGGGLT